MLLTTTQEIAGKKVTEHMGIISTEVIQGANVIKDVFAAFTDFFGGRSSKYELSLIKAKNQALDELKAKATKRGADAVIAIKMDYEVVGKGTMFMVNATGTAVKFS